MNNPPSYEDDPKLWEKIADLPHYRFFLWVQHMKRCHICNYSIEGKTKKYQGNLIEMIPADYLFHLKSTHGYDPEMVQLMLAGQL